MIKKYAWSVGLAIAVLVILSWSFIANSSPKELIVSAAASLQQSLLAIQPEFEMINPGIKLTFNFGSSGTLQQQIEQGAPSDLFISAGAKQMKALVNKGLVAAADQRTLLTNDLVLVMPIDSKITLAEGDYQHLTRGDFKKIAIGIPETVPAGAYAQQTLQYYQVYDSLKDKLVQAKDVRQVLTYVETGNADAGFVYRTDALTSKKVKIAMTIDAKAHESIEYPAGIVNESKHKSEAQKFYKYLQSKAAGDVFMKYGFKLPEAH